jgi:pimeloyl-ACP methyl ester carboxylesterase
MTTSARTETVRLNGIDLHYEIRGEGEPLLVLHGFAGCKDDWAHAGRDALAARYRVIAVDARGHGRSTGFDGAISHAGYAEDVLALLDHLGIARCKAIGMSFGGNTLLHVATRAPAHLDAMVLVSATMYFPEAARAIMRSAADAPMSADERTSMRGRHHHGEPQITALRQLSRALADDADDLRFTPPVLARIAARTLIVYGDRDPLYPVEMAVSMYRAIPNAALAVLPNAGHGPVFLDAAGPFTAMCLAFFN